MAGEDKREAERELKAWLQGLRENAGLSHQEVCLRLGVDVSYVYRWESPKGPVPDGLNLMRLLGAYGVTTSPSVFRHARSVHQDVQQLLEDVRTIQVRLDTLEESLLAGLEEQNSLFRRLLGQPGREDPRKTQEQEPRSPSAGDESS